VLTLFKVDFASASPVAAFVLNVPNDEVLPGASVARMEDATYFTNILRGRECSVCGADRGARTALAIPTCAVCHGSVDASAALLAIARGAAKIVCSVECTEVAFQEGLTGGLLCPACGGAWSAPAPPPRTCRSCAKDLSFDAGYLGLWESGRILAFCGTPCFELHRARVNPFCG